MTHHDRGALAPRRSNTPALTRPTPPSSRPFEGTAEVTDLPLWAAAAKARLRETSDLRKPAEVYQPRASHPAYAPPPRQSDALPIGTQARFITAARAAAAMGVPLNLLLTLRWSSLFSAGDPNPLRCLPIPARIDHLVEALRHWLTHRDLPAAYIWVRESAAPEFEHWHIALHVPHRIHDDLAGYVAHLTGEPRAPRPPPAARRTEGEFARGEIGSWHLAKDTQPRRAGFYLAAYVGKGEPSQRQFRGKLVDNTHKPVRGRSFGGTEPDGKYDAPQGQIIGTSHRAVRFFIARALQRASCQGLSRTGAKSPSARKD